MVAPPRWATTFLLGKGILAETNKKSCWFCRDYPRKESMILVRIMSFIWFVRRSNSVSKSKLPRTNSICLSLMATPSILSQLEGFTWIQVKLRKVSWILKTEIMLSIVAVKPLDQNEAGVKNVLLKSNAAGKYRGWTNTQNKDSTER